MLSNLSRPARSLITARPSTRLFSVNLARLSDQEKSSLDANKGSVGQKFQPDGEIGKTVDEKVGGPFSKDGAVGKQFRADSEQGAVGSTIQEGAEQMQGDKKSMFDRDGAIGKQFEKGGNIAQVGEAVGGPFSSEGAIGKQFTSSGSVGGGVQNNLGDKK